MIPSLVAQHLRRSIVEYLSTTFAISDDDTRKALAAFLADPDDGIFRGPYLRMRTPFVSAPDDADVPLAWLPDGFTPYVHQLQAWQRLSSRNHEPQPTLVTTGTGSGKTECFLYPVLDHCIRERAAGRAGIKALILYPMNALATDQARRLARLIADDPQLSSLRAGLFIGGEGRHATMTRDYLVDAADALVKSPPDILLTNYKMLDRLLLRADRRKLWKGTGPDTLRYVVLDEFHTYDGAQGTDVAMLLRRLGATLGMATDERPLGTATPVATSATLGSGRDAAEQMRGFAGRVFGVDFDDDAIVGEVRQKVEDACGKIDFRLPIPDVDAVCGIDETEPDAFDRLAALFTGADEALSDRKLGKVLRRHHLTRTLLAATGDTPRAWSDVRDAVVASTPQWGEAAESDPDSVDVAIARYVALLSLARRKGDRPLFPIEVQLWIREVSRLLRTVGDTPSFRWNDSARPDETLAAAEAEPDADVAFDDDGSGDGDGGGAGAWADGPQRVVEAPSIYCRHCGRAGWMMLQSEAGPLRFDAAHIYNASFSSAAQLRAMIRATDGEADVVWLDPTDGQIYIERGDGRVPVLITGGDDPDKAEERAKRSECPSCRNDDAIRFLGSQVASLASVSINQLFGMDARYVQAEERKLLAFVASVQDASHRAGFFTGRTHRFNLRASLARQIVDAGRTNLVEAADKVVSAAVDAGPTAVFALVPPDLLRDPEIERTWTKKAGKAKAGFDMLRSRVALEAQLEFGLRSTFGRTLELSGAACATVGVDERDDIVALVRETHLHAVGQQVLDVAVADYDAYLSGLLDRLRVRGAIFHPWLDGYVDSDGEQWHVWGGRARGMPAFPSGQSRPAFVTTGGSKNFDTLNSPAVGGTWLLDWARRTLGVELPDARRLTPEVFRVLADAGVITSRRSARGNTIYGLDPARVDLYDNDDDTLPGMLRCDVCSDRHAVPAEFAEARIGTPCLRFRCPGRYEHAPLDDANYYRGLYRAGESRRVVAAEHTSLLSREQREELEDAFKSGTRPDAPNVIAATPTLEMGIDIGDLSAVMLTSVPDDRASYIQRVGRAGRRSGNALVTTFVRADARNLYYLSDPAAMIAGDVTAPNCYLDAVEILRRQYLAYLIDRAAAGKLDAPTMPRTIGELAKDGRTDDNWIGVIVASGTKRKVVDGFLSLFGANLTEATADAMRVFADGGLGSVIDTAFGRWRDAQKDLELRRGRIKNAIDKVSATAAHSDEAARTLRTYRGEFAGINRAIGEHRNEYAVNALERLGLLPNYTLVDDTATLTATMWWQDTDGEYQTWETDYDRNGAQAVVEFAPGNTFYADGHEFLVDSIDVGSATEPAYEWWRLCPECGFGAPERVAASYAECPRCGQNGIADAGARHQLLRLRRAYSSASEESARVFDQSDERRMGTYDVVTSVDIDPTDITTAWKHTTEAFGVEHARSAIVRTVNVGSVRNRGDRVTIADHVMAAAPFLTCPHCGVVQGARRSYGPDDEVRHRGWCRARSGSVREEWQPLRLLHELQTEAVRMLLPLSDFQVGERLASFKAALMFGLRLDFGGEPDNIVIRESSFPNPGGQGKRRFLVLSDRVPGGTGYIARVADPDRLRHIFTIAREAISRCVCRLESRPACHRCLLSTVSRRDVGLVSRDIAVEILDQLLADWNFEVTDTVTDIAMARVDESELERRWKMAVRAWADRPDVDARIRTRPQPGRTDALELRIGSGTDAARYLIEEQIDMNVVPQTRPDFVIRRLDRKLPDICVYLDGFEFHASSTNNNIGHDAQKRAAVRADGSFVWNMTWDDVRTFHEAVTAEVPRDAPGRQLVDRTQRKAGATLHNARNGRLDFKTVDTNPVQLLLDLLADYDLAEWERLTLSAVGGAVAAAGATPVALSRDAVADAVAAVYRGLPVAGDGGDHAKLFRFVTPNGLEIAAFLDGSGERGDGDEHWTVVARLPDSDSDVVDDAHVGRWQDYLQWANLLQFLGAEGAMRRAAVITSASDALGLEPAALMLVPAALGADGDVAVTISDAVRDELDLLEDDATRDLVEAAAGRGAPAFVAGWEVPGPLGCGWQVEAAWPDGSVAVVADDAAADDEPAMREMLEWFADGGWQVRRASDWSVDDLVAALTDVTSGDRN